VASKGTNPIAYRKPKQSENPPNSRKEKNSKYNWISSRDQSTSESAYKDMDLDFEANLKEQIIFLYCLILGYM